MTPREKARLTKLVRAEVKAQMKRYAMARTREGFITALSEVLGAALSHHYRQLLGKLNNRTDKVEKWQRQKQKFLQLFTLRLAMPLKAKGLDRKKAVQQAIEEAMDTDRLRRRLESAAFQRTSQLKKREPLPENAHEDLLKQVREIVEDVFSE